MLYNLTFLIFLQLFLLFNPFFVYGRHFGKSHFVIEFLMRVIYSYEIVLMTIR
jgi:hypothetical protein